MADVLTIQFCKASTQIDRLRLCSYYTGSSYHTGSHTGLIGLLFTHTNGDFSALSLRDCSKSIGEGLDRSREGVGHEVLSLVQGVGRAIFSYP